MCKTNYKSLRLSAMHCTETYILENCDQIDSGKSKVNTLYILFHPQKWLFAITKPHQMYHDLKPRRIITVEILSLFQILQGKAPI